MVENAAQRVRSIHSAGLAVMRGERETFRHRMHLRALLDPDQCRSEIGSGEYHEAVVAMCVIGKAFPNRARGHLKRLKHIHTKTGEPEKFESFEKTVMDYLAPTRLSGHGYQTDSLTDLDLGDVADGLRALTAPMRDMGYEYFVNSGSLLGLTREGGLIEHDDDIDLAVILNAQTEADAIAEWRQVRDRLSELGFVDDENDGNYVCKLRRLSGVMIDLFPAWIEAGKVYVYPYSYGDLDEKDLRPLAKCATTDLPVPANAAAVLAQNYGATWQEPDPYFRFNWKGARDRFQKFLQIEAPHDDI